MMKSVIKTKIESSIKYCAKEWIKIGHKRGYF